MWKRLLFIVLPLVLLTLGGWWYWTRAQGGVATFHTVPVKRGDLVASISATGTVQPEEVVDVGAQVAGKIVAFGKDKHGRTVDYGSEVEAGTVLAQIDDSLYAADVATAKAQLAQSRANVKRAEADLGQLRARLYQAEQDWRRAQKLGPSDALSQSDFDAARSAFDVARANLNVGQAALLQAKEAVAQAQAALRRAQQNLDYCTIKSPVKGVIIDRRVNIGQTVVASLNAPSLFLIAKDLKRLQVWASVNEADIGVIRPGQPVTFTVDAHGGTVFQGEVGKIRLNATMTQNVVTYVVEIHTDNTDGRLIPYLTANLKFLVAERKNVLLVPNAALRWIARPEQMAPELRGRPKAREGSPPAGETASSGSGAGEQTGRGTLWTPRGAFVQPVAVRTGLTDGAQTEVQGEGLKEGLPVVVSDEVRTTGGPSSASPFTPQFFRGGSSAPARH
ncbi:MAG: HlyD family efflux transporter periplasmic adaptor subunit [Deltaproteobacteria bacterium]|nr:HlyD family efflux transporter periplasmic adaptor subunit [Deltaproteobacteria bacterium]